MNVLDKIEVNEVWVGDELSDKDNELYMKDFNFLPTIQVSLINPNTKTWKLIDDDPDIDIFHSSFEKCHQ